MNTLTDTHSETVFDVTLPPQPYPGLRPFEKHEWPIFFGRERMIDEVISRLIGQQFIVVHGDSGSGKSSLVRAGVLSRLEQESARGGIIWRTASMLPREAPLRNFAQALAEADGRGDNEDRITEIRRILNFGRNAPQALADLLRRGANAHLCILVDQFEEYFTFARRHGPDEARLFATILVSFAEQPPPGLYLVITMRSEFLGACAQHTGLAETVNRTQYLLPPMSHADLVRAIREPALLYDGEVSLELAERLIADAGNSQDQLPLIQHGLMLLHRNAARSDRAPNWRLTVAALGPDQHLADLLSNQADEIKNTVEPEGTGSVVENLFRALTELAEGKAVRRPQSLSDLVIVTGADEKRVREIVDAFRAEGVSFLRPYGEEPIAGTDLIDISHEALMRCWRRMDDRKTKTGWLFEELRSGARWRSLLDQAESFEGDSSKVLSPAMTEDRAQWLKSRNAAWAERYGGGWKRVQALIAASLATAAEAKRLEEERLLAVEQARRFRLLRWGVPLLVFLLCVSLVAVWYSWRERDIARTETHEATSQSQLAFQLREEAEEKAKLLEEKAKLLEETIQKLSKYDQADAKKLSTKAQQFSSARRLSQPETPPNLSTSQVVSLRVYIQIANESQREKARELELQLEKQAVDGAKIIVPGIELISSFKGYSTLRCLRANECEIYGQKLVDAVNSILQAPKVQLLDLSARYGQATNIRPWHYELWFGPGDIELKDTSAKRTFTPTQYLIAMPFGRKEAAGSNN